MTENQLEKKDAAVSVNNFLTKNLKLVIAIATILVVGVVAWAVIVTVSSSSTTKGLDAVESLNYLFVRDGAALEGDELLKKQNETLESLNPYLSKSGPVGTRANLFAADIYFAQKNYEEARKCYLNAAKQKKAYTSSLSYFNAAVCSEELDDLDGAASYYENASSNDDFVFLTHSMFSLGRVYEAKGDFSKAKDAYQKLFDKNPDDSWSHIAMDRLVALRAEGKIE